ncbi:Phospho-N-acetylmuramoyl-pentapeptide-transferase [Dirofilaria immitis]
MNSEVRPLFPLFNQQKVSSIIDNIVEKNMECHVNKVHLILIRYFSNFYTSYVTDMRIFGFIAVEKFSLWW